MSGAIYRPSRWNLSKFVLIKHFGYEFLHVEPSCCLDVAVYMLNCVFWWHNLVEIEFKSRSDTGSDSSMHSGIMRGSPTLDIDNKTPEKLSEANLRLRHALTINLVKTGRLYEWTRKPSNISIGLNSGLF